MTVVFAQRPYFDDYDENKKFLSILARPSYPLQAREFTQIQSILQQQLERLGDHFFKDGAKILDGELAFDTDIYYVKLESTSPNFLNLPGNILEGAASGAKASVIAVCPAEGDDPATLFVRFVSSDNSNTTNLYPGESFIGADVQGLIIQANADAIGKGSLAEINRGIYYVDGYFALVDHQAIILDKYSNVPSYRVGLQINKEVVTPEMDDSLKDNAMGSYNYAAPGAHRFKMELILSKIPLSKKTDNEDFIELGQIEAGKILKQVSTTDYNELEKTLARRTYDESGDYTVRPFKLVIREHRNNDRGAWTPGTFYMSGDVVRNADKIYVARNEGTSGYSNGPTHTSGISEASLDAGIRWEIVDKPPFNNGVFPAEGHITNVKIIDSGANYISAPDITFVSSTGGYGATAHAVVSDGKIVDVIVDNGGSGYAAGKVTAVLNGGFETIEDGTGLICRNADEAQVPAMLEVETDAGDANKLAVGLEAGKAYVRGFEIEKLGTTWLSIDKARETQTVWNDLIDPPVGNYFRVNNISGGVPLPFATSSVNGIEKFTPIEYYLYKDRLSVTNSTAVGTLKVRGMEWDSGDKHNGNTGIYRLYVYDVKLDRGIDLTRDVMSIRSGANGNGFKCNIVCEKVQLNGNVTITGTDVTGVGTNFTVEVQPGDYILANSSYACVTAVNGQSLLKVKNLEGGNASSALAYVLRTRLYEPNAAAAIYKLPESYVKTLLMTSTTGTTTRKIAVDYTAASFYQGTISQGTVRFTLNKSGMRSSAEWASVYETDNFIIFADGVITGIESISVLDGELVVTPVNKTGSVYWAMATTRHTAAEPRKKSVTSGSKVVTSEIAVQGSIVKLGVTDAFRLVSVLMHVDANYDAHGDAITNSSVVDITDRYELVTGQTDTYYGESYIKLKSGYSAPTHPFTINYNYFKHSTTGDYFSVDSYVYSDSDGMRSITYDEIPSYNGVRLSDVLDFRTNAISTDGVMPEMVKRGTEIEFSYQSYLPRCDRICLNYTGEFSVIPGVAAKNPQLPAVPELSMNLYNLTVSPYTFSTSDVVVETIDNKRYTMRDIGKLEQRINTLEQYTALSLLEQQTESMEITGSDGLSRFKQGFVVDNFQSPLLVNSGDDDTGCSIDVENGICRPSFTTRSVSMYELGSDRRASNNYKLYGKVYTLPLDLAHPHVIVVEQAQASRVENINPFAVATFNGSLSINPSSDDWYEVKYLPDNISQVEGNYLATKSALEGTVWNSWQYAWTGASSSKSSSTTTSSSEHRFKNQHIQYTSNGRRWWEDNTTRIFDRSGILTTNTTTTTTVTSTQIGQTRTGIKTDVTSKIDYEQVGDRLVSTSQIPYMRSRWLLIRANGLKPFTRYYPFFDNVGVDYWCVPCSRIDYKIGGTSANEDVPDFDDAVYAGSDVNNEARKIITTKNSFWPEETDRTCLDTGDVITAVTTGSTTPLTAVVCGVTKGPAATNPNEISRIMYVANIKRGSKAVPGRSYNDNGTIKEEGESFGVGTKIRNASGVTATVTYAEPNLNHIRDGLVTNSSGELYLMFWIPDGDKIDYGTVKNSVPAFQFRCGDRIFSLSDNKEDNNSNAEATYSATGVLGTRQRDINAVRNAVITKTTVNDSRTIISTSSKTTTSQSYKFQPVDPLAQTFNVDIPGGCFLSKVDIYFATKPTNTKNLLPVRIQIRTCENGIPSANVLPFSEVSLRPDQVKLSDEIVQYVDATGKIVTAAKYDTPTTFVFETPVYIDETHEYAIVLLSDSNDYHVWTAAVGDVVPGQQSMISKQPYTGTLLKSQNASTWTPDQTQDLKFTIYRANFRVSADQQTESGSTAATRSPVIANVQFAAHSPTFETLERNCFETVNGSNLVRVYHDYHGMQAGGRVTLQHSNINEVDGSVVLTGRITASTDSDTITGVNTSFALEVRKNDTLYYIDETGTYHELGDVANVNSSTVITLTDNAKESVENAEYSVNTDNDTINGILFKYLEGEHEVISSDMNSFIISTSASDNGSTEGRVATSTGYAGDGYWQSRGVYNYDVIQPNLTLQTFNDTSVMYSISALTTAMSRKGMLVEANQNNMMAEPCMIADPSYSTSARDILSADSPSLILNVQMVSSNPCLTPMIDSDRVSAVLVNNLIDNPKEEDMYHEGFDSKLLLGTSNATVSSSSISGLIVSGNVITSGSEANDKKLALASVGKYLDITVKKSINGSNVMQNIKTLITDMKTVNDHVQIHLQDSLGVNAVYCIKLRTRFTDEIAALGGSAYSKYITKPITFGGTSTMLRVLFAASVPSAASIDVYYKSYLNAGSEGYDEVEWKLMGQSNTLQLDMDVDSDTFHDYEYTAEDIAAFDVAAVKLVFRSSISTEVPKVKDLRILATI